MAHRLREFRFTKAQQARLWELMEPDDALLLCVEGLIDNYAVELGIVFLPPKKAADAYTQLEQLLLRALADCSRGPAGDCLKGSGSLSHAMKAFGSAAAFAEELSTFHRWRKTPRRPREDGRNAIISDMVCAFRYFVPSDEPDAGYRNLCADFVALVLDAAGLSAPGIERLRKAVSAELKQPMERSFIYVGARIAIQRQPGSIRLLGTERAEIF